MNKEELKAGILKAKKEHIRWITYAEAKFNGLKVDEELIPVEHYECECGKWMNGMGQILYHFDTAKALIFDHKEFHRIYKELYDHMEFEHKGTIFTKKANQKKKASEIEKYANTLRSLTNSIQLSFDIIINEVSQMDDKNIYNLFGNLSSIK